MTLVEIRKRLFAVVMYMLPVVARGQGKGLTLPSPDRNPNGFLQLLPLHAEGLKHRPCRISCWRKRMPPSAKKHNLF